MKIGTEVDEKITAEVNAVLTGGGSEAAEALKAIQAIDSVNESLTGGEVPNQKASGPVRQITWETLTPAEMYHGLGVVIADCQAEYDDLANNRDGNIKKEAKSQFNSNRRKVAILEIMHKIGYFIARLLFGTYWTYILGFHRIWYNESDKNREKEECINAANKKDQRKAAARNKGGFDVAGFIKIVIFVTKILAVMVIFLFVYMIPVLMLLFIFLALCLIMCRLDVALKVGNKLAKENKDNGIEKSVTEQYDDDLLRRKEHVDVLAMTIKELEGKATMDEAGNLTWDMTTACNPAKDDILTISLNGNVTKDEKKRIVKMITKEARMA